MLGGLPRYPNILKPKLTETYYIEYIENTHIIPTKYQPKYMAVLTRPFLVPRNPRPPCHPPQHCLLVKRDKDAQV